MGIFSFYSDTETILQTAIKFLLILQSSIKTVLQKKKKASNKLIKLIVLFFTLAKLKNESHYIIIICHSHNLQFYLLLPADCDGFPKPVSKKPGTVNYHKLPKHSRKHSQSFSSLIAAQPDGQKNCVSLDVCCDFFKGSFRELAAFVLQFLYCAFLYHIFTLCSQLK